VVRKALVTAFCFASALSGCSDKGATAPSAALIVSLSSPNQQDGAMAIVLRGPDLESTQSIKPTTVLYQRLVGTNESHVLIVGDITRGDLLRVEVLGLVAHPISEYSATVTEVATRTDSSRASVQGYALTLREEQ